MKAIRWLKRIALGLAGLILLLLVLAWAIAAGRLLVLPWAVAVASLLVQTHVSYTYLAPFVILTGIALALASDRTAWRRHLARPSNLKGGCR